AKGAIEQFAKANGTELCGQLLDGLANTAFEGHNYESSPEFAEELRRHFNENRESWKVSSESQ
ncbi:MAG: hypothetical protein LBD33_02695, partial [Puniceicoccales bacterium]|nr:hypothetical protein [Puniceicoccales bacterium]